MEVVSSGRMEQVVWVEAEKQIRAKVFVMSILRDNISDTCMF